MKLKVCGITSLTQLQQLEALSVDYAGLIFYEKSKRFAGERLLTDADEVKKFAISKVGVFVNAPLEEILQIVQRFNLQAVQLHGDEPPQFCEALRQHVPVVKVFRLSGREDVDEISKGFQEVCDYFLFDTATPGYGGSGQQFDREILLRAKIEKPFFLSGGLGPADADDLLNFHHPHLHAVDVNSRFETAPGIKDMRTIGLFKNKIHG